MMVGGFGSVKTADAGIVNLCNEIKGAVETKLGKTYNTFEPIQYTTQVVAGTNYKVKVKVDDGDYIHIKIFKPLPCNGTELSLTEASSGHSLEEGL